MTNVLKSSRMPIELAYDIVPSESLLAPLTYNFCQQLLPYGNTEGSDDFFLLSSGEPFKSHCYDGIGLRR